jgi:hypothetical protein
MIWLRGIRHADLAHRMERDPANLQSTTCCGEGSTRNTGLQTPENFDVIGRNLWVLGFQRSALEATCLRDDCTSFRMSRVI